MGGEWWPAFNDGMLQKINYWRFMNGLDDVTIGQVAIHFLHRVMALILLIWLAIINSAAFRKDVTPRVRRSVIWLDLGFLAQVLLGITAVWSIKEPYVTSVHVVFGAGVLGLAVLLFLRARPVLDHDIQI